METGEQPGAAWHSFFAAPQRLSRPPHSPVFFSFSPCAAVLSQDEIREEIEAKQLASLTGKAHQKEWNYAMYENRKRRIPRNQVKLPLYESIERAAYEKFMEDEERRLRREALGLFD